MRVVHIEDFFHPNAGYQINILPKYMVKKGIETFIITSEIEKVPTNLTAFFGKKNLDFYDSEFERMTGIKIIRVPVKRFISSRAIFTNKLYQVVENLSPDALFVHGNDTFIGMKYIWKQKKLKCALISDSHMLEMASVNKFNKVFRKFYKTFITPKIIKNKLIVIRTQDDTYVNKCLGIPIEQSPWISYGSDTLLFHPNKQVKRQFRIDNNLSEDTFIILYAGKLDKSKGGMFLAESIKDKFITKRKIAFVIIGNTAGDYGKKVEKLFSDSENTVLRFSTQRYVDLAKFFQSADLAVFPKQCSLSFFDAQASGLPVVFENNNINVDRCKHNNGFVFKAGDKADFRKKIQYCIDMNGYDYKKIQKNAYEYIINNYDYSKKADAYIEKIKESIDLFNKKNNKYIKDRTILEESSKKNIRVLHFTSKLSAGGVQSFLINYAKNINKNEVVFDYVVQTKQEAEFDKLVKNNGSIIYNVTSMEDSIIGYVKDVYKLLKEHPEYQVIHTHLNYRNIFPLIAAKLAGVNTRISHSHSNYEANNLLIKLERKLFQKIIPFFATDYFACSKSSGIWLYGNKNKNSIKVIHNAIYISKYRYSETIRNFIRVEQGLDNKFVLIHVGMFGKAKNHEFLIDFFNYYLMSNPETILILCGDGPERSNIEKKINNYGINENVKLLGTIDNVNEWLMASDMMLVTSFYEGLPLVCVEAQATGCPMVVSDAVPDEVIFNKNVSKCNKWDYELWKNCIEKAKKVKLNRKKAYLNCLDANYDIINEAEKLKKIYLKLYRRNKK